MPLPEDLIRGLQQRTVIPEGNVPGTRLTWLGPTDADIDWTSDPDPRILDGHGDPNGVVVAEKGIGLYVDVDEPGLWQNIDNLDAWQQIGKTAGDFDYLRANDDGSGTGIASGTQHTLTFTVVGGDTSGTDISIDTGVPTINTDGLYSVMLWLGVEADAAADTFNYAQLQLSVLRGGFGPRDGPALVTGFYPSVDAANKHNGEAAITPTLFCPAGTTLEARALMRGGGAGTWSVIVGALHVDRIG